MTKVIGKKRAGVALLFAVGILGILSIIGVSFAINMIAIRKQATNFLNSEKARYIAEAGIMKAVMDIRDHVTSDSYTNLKSYCNSYITTFSFGEGVCGLTVVSEESKVNINTFDPETDNSQLTILRSFLTNQQIANIIDYRDSDSANTTIGGSTGNIEGTPQCKNKPFDTIEEIRVATGISHATLYDAPSYNINKITLYKPIIRGGLLGKYYKNIAGASPNVAIDTSSFTKKVVELGPIYTTPNNVPLPGTDGYEVSPVPIGSAETQDAEFAGGSSVAAISDYGLETFGVIWDGYIDVLQSEVNVPVTFSVTVDDGARLFIDGTSILPAASWQDQGSLTYSGNYTFQTAGWHKIRLEYYDNTYDNTVQVKWNAGGSLVVIPAERLGYDPPTELTGGYNHAGMYTITATAQVTENAAIVATKKITAVVEVFGTWTQTTKEEFYAAWFNEKGNFRDGEAYNVNWLDNCPTDKDYWDGTSKMHWEGNYTKTKDSVKLGYWDDFDEDPAFSAVMMKGYVWNKGWHGLYPYGYETLVISFQSMVDSDGDGDNELYIDVDPYVSKHFELNRNYFRPDTASVFVRAHTNEPAPSSRIVWKGEGTLYTGPMPLPSMSYWFAGNKWIFYYDANGNGVIDLPYTEQVFPVYRNDPANGNPPVYIYNPTIPGTSDLDGITTYTYFQVEAPFVGCWIYAKGNANDTSPGWNYGATMYANGFKALMTDADHVAQTFVEPRPQWPDGDRSEIRCGQGAVDWPFFQYKNNKVISMIGWDAGSQAEYATWVDGTRGGTVSWADWTLAYGTRATVNYSQLAAQGLAFDPLPIFKFVANNQYLGQDWWTYDRGQHVIACSDWAYAGGCSMMRTHWDNIRCIPEKGYLVSTPFYAGQTVKWGTVSWSGQTPSPTSIEISTRTTSTNFPTTDVSWAAAASNGASLGGTDTQIQYKAALAAVVPNTHLNRFDYQTSSQTPVLEDVTITYLPTVQIKYLKEGL